MKHLVWQAEVTQQEWDDLSELDLEQMSDDLDIFWEQLKLQYLDKYVHHHKGD